jgi:hypothetical protein
MGTPSDSPTAPASAGMRCPRSRVGSILMIQASQKVAMLIPYFVDQMNPQIGFDMAAVLQRIGYGVEFEEQQTCCGQPAFNTGYWKEARPLAKKVRPPFPREGNCRLPVGIVHHHGAQFLSRVSGQRRPGHGRGCDREDSGAGRARPTASRRRVVPGGIGKHRSYFAPAASAPPLTMKAFTRSPTGSCTP